MIRINLLPVKASKKKDKLRGQLLVAGLCVVLAVAGCAGVYASLLFDVDAVKEEISKTEAEISRLKKSIGEVGRFKKLQEELQGKLDVLDKLKAGKSGPVHLLDELSAALPEKLWITSFKESGGNISLQGVGLNEETVARFLRSLEASPYYRNVELRVIEQTGMSGLKLHRFDVACNSETPAADSAEKR